MDKFRLLPLAPTAGSIFLIGAHVSAASMAIEKFNDAQRWLLSGGLGVGMFCLWVYVMLYGVEGECKLFMGQTVRIGMRLIVAIVLIIIPEPLNHLVAEEFMFVVMALYAFLLVWETVGGLSKTSKLYEPWMDKNSPPDEDDSEGLAGQ
ncbi:hypothetical protein H9L39_20338 [Fusarium oxysporum f. sp. albedinis]|nr:hypothetical protein H9L39_20338 [Fusarium oxysporum f. sp. albedinis]